MKINDGYNISASLRDSIMIAYDDTNYNFSVIKSSILSVVGQSDVRYVVTLNLLGVAVGVEINLSDVTNQASWTLDQAGLTNAISDINGWINSSAVDNASGYAKRLDDTSTPNVTYIGKAKTGTLGSDPLWQMQKMNTASGVIITWADGDDSFSNVWDDRTSLTYS